jgi:enoyl-CoA hydratase/carnithine racemase
VPTIAALNGHAFGAGAMLAMAHDFRADARRPRLLLLPRSRYQHPVHPRAWRRFIQGKLTPAAAIASMTTGRRFGGRRRP